MSAQRKTKRDREYASFVASKLTRQPPTGLAVVPQLDATLFPHQSDLTSWALRRGRAAVFADTGLGKTRCEIEFARCVPGASLILTPLGVTRQIEAEARSMGILARVCRDASDVTDDAITITNYDRLHLFDASRFHGVILDESSCIKHQNSKTFDQLLRSFASTPFKLCGTATPAPNDWTELGTHAEFLGICTRQEMLSEYFVHDGGETQVWRLKGHARGAFWKWVASWAALVRLPSDLGYDDTGYVLPPLETHQTIVKADADTVKRSGLLFAAEAQSLMDRKHARRVSISDRVAQCAAQVNAEPAEPWIVWCDLNAESEALVHAIPGAIEVRGSMTIEEKESALARFAAGEVRVIITKPSICGWGLNWQHCARMSFVGVTDSWEQYYQAVRRSWRFGQKRTVKVYIYASEMEGAVVANIQRKERDARTMSDALSVETRDAVRAEIRGSTRHTNTYAPRTPMAVPRWLTGDSE